jgi:nitrogenase molybdenum-iron protein alpha chain
MSEEVKLATAPIKEQESAIQEMVTAYPAKVGKKRNKHIIVRDSEQEAQEVAANVRTVPGIITQRHCAFAGCKGVVVGPFGDVLHIVHGPVGCSYYTWMTRRNQYKAREDGKNFLSYCLTTDMQDSDIVFGGVNKLRQAVQEGYDIFKPNAITITATCPVGLIGDDIQSVAKEMTEKLGISVVAFNCEGYKGVSQSAGHHIANNGFFKYWVGTDEETEEIEGFAVNILGEYNIGGDAWEIERVFNKCGIKVISTFSGDAHYEDTTRSHLAKLNLVMCHRSINYMAEMMEKKYGIPWIKVNFIGVQAFAKSLRKIGEYFEDEALKARIEEVIAEELTAAEEVIAPIRERLQGKTAILFVGGSRAHHYQDAFADLGIKTIAAGYEFAHRDDYEGREVLPRVKVDADSRNIEELHVERDPERYNPPKSPETLQRMKEEGLIGKYDGMIPEMGAGTLIIDDVSQHELDVLIKRFNPSIIGSGIKDKYIIEKWGVPCKQLHNYDYGGPFAGFKGAMNFAQDIDMRINAPAWKHIPTPWKK